MDALRIETLSNKQLTDEQKQRQEAMQVAGQFEAIFVRTMVQSLRQSATMGGEAGLFGSGPGADTYADWFDQNLAEKISSSGEIGVKSALLAEFDRNQQKTRPAAEPTARSEASKALAEARRAADKQAMLQTRLPGGGIDVRH